MHPHAHARLAVYEAQVRERHPRGEGHAGAQRCFQEFMRPHSRGAAGTVLDGVGHALVFPGPEPDLPGCWKRHCLDHGCSCSAVTGTCDPSRTAHIPRRVVRILGHAGAPRRSLGCRRPEPPESRRDHVAQGKDGPTLELAHLRRHTAAAARFQARCPRRPGERAYRVLPNARARKSRVAANESVSACSWYATPGIAQGLASVWVKPCWAPPYMFSCQSAPAAFIASASAVTSASGTCGSMAPWQTSSRRGADT